MKAEFKENFVITCPQCHKSLALKLSKDWDVNLLGIIQVRHRVCGRILNIGEEAMWADASAVQEFEKEKQETILINNLFNNDPKQRSNYL